jgi:hypothetical protein
MHEALKIFHYIFLVKKIQKFHQNKKELALNFNYILKVRETTNGRFNFVKQETEHKILGLYSINTFHASVYSSIRTLSLLFFLQENNRLMGPP